MTTPPPDEPAGGIDASGGQGIQVGDKNSQVNNFRTRVDQVTVHILQAATPWSRRTRALASLLALAVLGLLIYAFYPDSQTPRLEIDGIQILAQRAVGFNNTKVDPVKVDIKLRNTGNQLAVINGASLRILQLTHLPVCSSQGALPATGDYQANMPTHARPGRVINIPLSQQVGPDQADRFDLTLRIPNEASADLYVYRAQVSLSYDNVATPVGVGTIIVSLPYDPTNFQYVWTRKYQADHGRHLEFAGLAVPKVSRCMIANSKILGTVLAKSGQRSAPLRNLQSELAFCCTARVPAINVLTAGQLLVRPARIYLATDGTSALENMKWTKWNFSSATGTGILHYDGCATCQGVYHFINYPVVVHLSDPTPYLQSWAFGKFVVSFPGKNPTHGKNIILTNQVQ